MPDHRRPSLTLALAASLLLAVSASADEPPPAAVLHLRDGGFVPGTLADTEDLGVIRWQGTSFAEPFDFDLKAVDAVRRPAPAKPPRPVGDFRFELAGGDAVFGALASLDETEVVVDTPRFGPLHVRRADVRRIDRWRDDPDLVYAGPNGLADWHQPAGESAGSWVEESGALFTAAHGAALRADLGLPARAVVEFELSWKYVPDFVLALGVNDDEKADQRAFRFEVWESTLIALRETDDRADLAPLGKVTGGRPTGPGRARFRAYLDQERGRLVVYSAKGERLADLKVADGAPRVLTGVLLENRAGDVRLDRLRVSRWDGELPADPRVGSAEVRLTDGTAADGHVTRYDAAAKAFVVRGEDEDESLVPSDRVSSVLLSPPGDEPPRLLKAVLQDGSRLSGALLKVEKGELWMSVPGVKETPRLPAAELRSLVVTLPDGSPRPVEKPAGRLELESVKLAGRLVDGRDRPGASCLTWHPLGSNSASPLRPGVSGRIVYKEPPTKPKLTAEQSQQLEQLRLREQLLRQRGVQPQPAQPRGFLSGFAGDARLGTSRRPKSLYLRTGDTIPVVVSKIDEAGVTFRSTAADRTFVPHDKVKAVELAAEPGLAVKLNKSKRERLLTLPRVQKGSPPTHLIRSVNGDYLRGRVVGMDARTLRVEVRLETREVPRDRISRIIWLHADELEPTAARPEPPGPAGATRVQVVRDGGVRLTFRAEECKFPTLSGTSDVLGACRVDLGEAEQVLIGAAIERESARLAYRQWKLQNAPEPKVVQGDDGPDSGGRSSAMVGKPAPDFELELLDGKLFRLSASKGQVVVLDFWATWCGPCLQSMPQVEKVAQEFRGDGVRLIAVNLLEPPDAITAMLERHKMTSTVALDRDGVVADKYGASTIPQTVVIDRDGNVARLYIGGGPHLGDQLRDALKSLPPAGGPKGPKG